MDKEKTLRKLKQEIEEVREKFGVEFAEVVRCKDCEHFRNYTDRHGAVRMICMRDCHIPRVEPEHFCSYGERNSEVHSNGQ